jgi:predicted GNAT family N-acyltransferase
MEINLKLEDTITEPMRQLRESSYADFVCSVDEFDVHSKHMTAWSGGEPVGMVRLTPSTHSYLRSEIGSVVDIPAQRDHAEMSRAIVREDMRGKGFYPLLLTAGLQAAFCSGASTAIGFVRVALPQRPFLYTLGFEPWGRQINIKDFGDIEPLRMDLDRTVSRLRALYRERISRMACLGIHVNCG